MHHCLKQFSCPDSGVTLKGASHFVQEEVGPELAKIIDDFIKNNPWEDAVWEVKGVIE